MKKEFVTLSSLAVACLAVFSCSESLGPKERATIPRVLAPPNRISPDMQKLPAVQKVLSATPGSTVEVVSYPFLEGVLADITITGIVTLKSHPDAWPIAGPISFNHQGIQVPNANGCLLNAQLSFSTTPGPQYPFGGGPPCLQSSPRADVSVRAVVGGTGTAVRGAMPVSNTCDGPCWYEATGSQTITITPLEADVDFQGTYGGKRAHALYVPAFVDPAGTLLNGYHQVIFSDSTFPRGMPLRNLNHSWFFADPADPGHGFWKKTVNECYAGWHLCWVNIKESGLMKSTTRVNGVEHSDSVAIECALDSILDASSPRSTMRLINAIGDGTNPNPAVRTEQNMAIARDNSTGAMVALQITANSTDQCSSRFNLVNPAAPSVQGYTIMAYVHTHPQYLGEKYPCPNPTTHATGAPGGSVEDWAALDSMNLPPSRPVGNPPIVMYVMANDYIYKLDRSLGQGPDMIPRGRWDKGRCKWVKH